MRFLTTILPFVAMPLKAWVLSTIWGWYMVDHFHLPSLPLKQSIGVVFFVTLLTYKGLGLDRYYAREKIRSEDAERYDYVELTIVFIESFIIPLLILFLAYAVWSWF